MSALLVLQDALYGGLPAGTPFGVAVAQYTLPWLTWAVFAPLLLTLFSEFPIDLRRPARGMSIYVVGGMLFVGLKLLLSAPAAALFIWQPLDVQWQDGLRWLLANRAGANLLTFWLLASCYTAYRYYRAHLTKSAVPFPARIDRIPVRAGDGVAFVRADQVSFIEVERNQLVIHAGPTRHTLRGSLQDVEARLPADRFIRIHRSRLVNVDQVLKIEPWGRGDYLLILRDGTRLHSGKTYREAIRRLLDLGSV